jgi:hypothetical protein
MRIKSIMFTIAMALAVPLLHAQGYVDQEAVSSLLESRGTEANIGPVTWHTYNIGRSGKTQKAMLKKLQAHLDSLPGERTDGRLAIVELSNRVQTKYMMQRGTLLVPDSFPEDFRAYSPYPQHYAGADSLAKLFIIDKYTQTFGAYEHGRLVRWGLVCAGRDDDLTPGGRYSFNWKQAYRESTAAPEGEVWRMRWVFNFDAAAGIHVHQYALPIATPASHGCVRMSEADAHWNFDWADSWTRTDGRLVSAGTPVIVINHNPVGLAAHWSEDGYSLVMLPDDPMSIPPGPGATQDRLASKE